ncbi:MAG TPA: hypothetical protein VK777_08265 [Reyranella sp.]|jgi:hypothetical protein|nr:hypothetical protein [Reyranella sp.]
MPMFTLKAAAAQLPQLIARAEAGEEIRYDREWPGRALQTMW